MSKVFDKEELLKMASAVKAEKLTVSSVKPLMKKAAEVRIATLLAILKK